MTRFIYKAIPLGAGGSSSGVVDGRQEAPDERSLRDRLHQQGLLVLEIKPVSSLDAVRSALGRHKLRRSDAAWFFQTLHRLLAGRVPIESAIATMEELSPKPQMQAACAKVREALRSGSSLADAVEAVGSLAAREHLALLRIGHESGRLPHAVELIERSIATKLRLRKLVAGRLIYPIILLSVSLIAVWILSTFVIPRFAETLASAGVELPLTTRLTMAASRWLMWLAPAGALAIAGAAMLRSVMLPPQLAARIDRFTLRLPILGTLRWNAQAAVAADTLATIIEGGGDILTGLEQASFAMQSGQLRERLDQTRKAVREGESLGEAIARFEVIPPMPAAIVRVGMKSGDLVGALQRASDLCVERQEELALRLLTLMEPAIILFLASVVGWVFYSLLAGILTMNDLGAGAL